MTIESKKMIGMVGSALAVMVVVAGNILMATQIKSQGAGFFVGYLFYSLAILAGGMFITWLPNMKNYIWGFKMVDGRLKWCKDERVQDIRRTRLVWWSFITLCFELYGLFDYCNDLWQRPWTATLMFVFLALVLLLLFVWVIIMIVDEYREAKKNNGQL